LEAKQQIAPTEHNIAIIVDICTQIFRIEQAAKSLVYNNPWHDEQMLVRNMGQLQEAIRVLELNANRIPHYGERNGKKVFETRRVSVDPRDLFTKQELESVSQVATQLANARTLDEHNRILQAAGLLK
jgi:hypothetical protein